MEENKENEAACCSKEKSEEEELRAVFAFLRSKIIEVMHEYSDRVLLKPISVSDEENHVILTSPGYEYHLVNLSNGSESAVVFGNRKSPICIYTYADPYYHGEYPLFLAEIDVMDTVRCWLDAIEKESEDEENYY